MTPGGSMGETKTVEAEFICKDCNKIHRSFEYESKDFEKEGVRKHIYSLICIPLNNIIGTIEFKEPLPRSISEIRRLEIMKGEKIDTDGPPDNNDTDSIPPPTKKRGRPKKI